VDRVQQNGGTAGFITAIALALLFISFISSGLDPQTMQDPARAIPMLAQKAGVFAAIGVLGALAAGFGLVFTIGLFARLRDRAPTRAAASLGLAFVGLTGHGLGSLLLWQGGQFLVTVSAKDPTAADHAWIATAAVAQGLNGLGDAFTGGSLFVAGWAVVTTGAMAPALGWLGVIAGIFQALQLFSAAPVLMLLGIILVIIWLAWGGSQLRSSTA
jgi:hypothetical protein